MPGLLTRAGYEPIVVGEMEAAKQEVAKLSPGAVIVTAMKFRSALRERSSLSRRVKKSTGLNLKRRAINSWF